MGSSMRNESLVTSHDLIYVRKTDCGTMISFIQQGIPMIVLKTPDEEHGRITPAAPTGNDILCQ